ncbi:NAD(P)/FAD-dependent oxidoreductase [Micromonospora radicis]|uniref:FAD-dependent oxidoreductase n=1 Tax=Micromonospora radicis TaxID=1894971 RepID=A0A418MX66_9ACTN|nr:FAD-dependent oxidoreductase [Micromonospora radicis]RIV39626.1 FAD-dependent oxidoreductase [Micromonospora radicis]
MAASGHAVVVGASLGGLLAARALAETYAQVTLLDRDKLPAGPAPRRGVPQGRQVHVLLARGRQILEELFPGLGAELYRQGATPVDLHGQVHWYNDGHRMRSARSDLTGFGMSRPLLEHAVRDRVTALPGVRVLPECEVTGLTATPDQSRVTGVRLAPATGRPDELRADLVVDAAGRGSRSPVWLAELGYPAAPQEQVEVGVTYVTRRYRREDGQLDGMLGVLANAMPGRPRYGVVAPQEGGRFAVTMAGILGEQPPTDDEGFARFAASLTAPQVGELVRHAEPLDDPVLMRFPASVRRRYERLPRFPAGYLVFADALCSLNPVYGQGITVAALQTLLLRRLLARDRDRLARRFFPRAARLIDAPWSIAVGADLRFPGVRGRRTPAVRLVNAYLARLHAAASNDAVLGAAFLRVLNLIDPPARLLGPDVLLRVLAGRRQRPSASSMAR